ncbi:mutator protein MutT, partial [marine sediment metagenome]
SRPGTAASAPLTFASHSYDDFHLLMPGLCLPQVAGHRPAARRPVAGLGPAGKLRDYPMPAADIPLIPMLQMWL